MSRYAFCWDVDIRGVKEKLPRGRFRYRRFFDTVSHVCQDRETLWGIAAQYYTGFFPSPEMMYWVIGDFQPEPIADPTVRFKAGQIVYVPSVRVVKLYLDDPVREPDFEAW